MIVSDRLVVLSSNNIIGDPRIGVKKQLVVKIDGEEFITDEGNWFIYPRTKLNKLGVWYSNNSNKNQNAINKSLETIRKAAEGKADIVTCVWKHIEDNPFLEIISWYKESTHLNQLLQIMQCLYYAKNIGAYDYVSFLEHDVMYPEGYFDFNDFNNGTIITNMNYGGINIYGWQEAIHKHEPMHQMTMKFSDAIEHFHKLIPNALITNSGNIENNTLVRKKWYCKNQSIHINHGNHFTNHYSIYDQNKNLPQIHSYWGNYSKYKYLLN